MLDPVPKMLHPYLITPSCFVVDIVGGRERSGEGILHFVGQLKSVIVWVYLRAVREGRVERGSGRRTFMIL